MRIKGPYGECPWCGQEYMKKVSLERHILDCPERPEDGAQEPVEAESIPEPQKAPEEPRYRPRMAIGGTTVWLRK